MHYTARPERTVENGQLSLTAKSEGVAKRDTLAVVDARRKCTQGAVIVLACVIFSAFASSPPVVDTNAAAASMVWSYIGELIFNMLILVGSVKMADRVVREMMGL